jgi:hypothetical protein
VPSMSRCNEWINVGGAVVGKVLLPRQGRSPTRNNHMILFEMTLGLRMGLFQLIDYIIWVIV